MIEMKDWEKLSNSDKFNLVHENFELNEDQYIEQIGTLIHYNLMIQGKEPAFWDFSKKKKKVIELLDSFRDDLIQEFCEKRKYCNKIKNSDIRDKISFGVMVADYILAILVVKLPVFILSSYIVRFGLNRLCEC